MSNLELLNKAKKLGVAAGYVGGYGFTVDDKHASKGEIRRLIVQKKESLKGEAA